MEEMGVFDRICKNCGMRGQKDMIKYVVSSFLFRGGSILTRLEVVVVWREKSCLGDLSIMGINDSIWGSNKC